MTFLRPLALLGLVGIPLVAVLYVVLQRRRVAAASAFAAPHLAASFAPHQPGFRRHLPLAVLLLALAVLVVAVARPARGETIAIRHASIVLATDISSSMAATDVAPTRLKAAEAAALRFLSHVPANVGIGVMAFNQKPNVLQSPTTDRSGIRRELAGLTPVGGTATGDAIQLATRVIVHVPPVNGTRPPGAIVLLSDGTATHGSDPLAAARAAKRKHIPIYTVALGTATGTIEVPNKKAAGTHSVTVPPSPKVMAQLASASGGQAFTAETAERLSAVYDRLGFQLGHRRVKRELTAGFAGGALLLVALGSAMSLRWFGRLI